MQKEKCRVDDTHFLRIIKIHTDQAVSRKAITIKIKKNKGK